MTKQEPNLRRVGVVEGALVDERQFAALAALFPDVQFEVVGLPWPDRATSGMDLLLVGVDAAAAADLAELGRCMRLAPELRVVVVLRNADVTTTRRLMSDGAADVVPAPASETSLAVTIDKLLRATIATTGAPRHEGEVIAILKAGGGVGATAIAVQAATMVARRGASVCFADLDLQFGAAALYMDLPDAATVSDCMSAGAGLSDIDFSTLLARHASGARLLAAPHQVTPLDALAPPQADALVGALKRHFSLVVVDLPSVWTSWTNRALQIADRIAIVTHLSVPHMHMVDRQMATLRAQGLENRHLTLICNAHSPEQTAILQLKSAERALGRPFDVVVPEDRKAMYAAINQGVEIRRGSKLEKAIGEFATLLSPDPAPSGRGKSWWSRKP